MPELSHRVVRFGAFEVDLERSELRKQGLRVRLQDQPFQVLVALLERPGEVVSRDELIRRLWPDGTVVDFDRGVNAAVTRLRQALSDSADAPRYVETVARRGYRFLVAVERVGETPPPQPSPPPVSPRSRSRFWPAAIPLFVLVAAGAWWAVSRTRGDARGESWKATVLTGAVGLERNPSFSPEGTQLVYEWERDGERHLYLKAVGPGDPIPLTSGRGADYGPAWSPDGKSIAFLRQEEPTKFALFVIAPVGGTARKVADVPPFPLGVLRKPYRRLDWTRDSRHLVASIFGREDSPWEGLALVSVDSGETTWLTEHSPNVMFGDREPAVSPDGKLVAFARGSLTNETIYVLPLTAEFRPAGAPRQISGTGPARSPAWMADGRQLVYTNLKPGVITGYALATIDLDSGKPPRNLVELGSNASTPAVSRQGMLAYSTRTVEGNIWRQYVASGGQPVPPVKVSAAAAVQLLAQYSPDGSRIAFFSERSGTREIWNCAQDGGHCLQITSGGPLSSGPPRWSPDGKQLVFDAMVEGASDVYVVDANGGVPRRLTGQGPHGNVPYWSHDGKWIYYSSAVNAARQLWKVPAAGGQALRVANNGAFMVIESPDSKHLYYIKAGPDGKLFRSGVDGSGETELLSGVAYWGFAVTDDRIYYLHEPSAGSIEIRQFLLATGDDSRVAGIDKPLTAGLSVSPDGKSVLYSELKTRSSLMLAETIIGR